MSHRSIAVVLGVLFGLTALGSASTAVVAPSIADDLGLSTGGVAAIFVAFGIAFAAATPIYGRWADITGERGPLLVGILLMATGSIVVAFAPGLPVLIAGRIVQGAGAGAIPALIPGVLRSRVPDSGQVVALGVVAATVGVFSAIGPFLGGVAGSALGWRLAISLPVAGLLLVPLVYRLASNSGNRTLRLDRVGATATVCAVTGLILLLQAPGLGRNLALVGGLLVVGSGLFWRSHQRTHGDGFTPDIIIRSRLFWLNALVGAALSAVYLSLLVAVPIRLATEQSWSAIVIGAALLPAAAVGPLASTAGNRLANHYPAQAIAGAGVVAAGLGAAAAALTTTPAVQIVGFGAAILGVGLAQPVLIDRVGRGTDPSHLGVAIGLFNMLFFVGGAVGSALVGSFGVHGGSLIAAVIAVAAGITLAVAPQQPRPTMHPINRHGRRRYPLPQQHTAHTKKCSPVTNPPPRH